MANKRGNTKIAEMLDEARFLRNYTGDQKKAIKVCDKILELLPDNIDAMLIKAGALSALFEIDKSDELLKSIMEKWPEHWEAYYLYAGSCFARQDNEKTLEMIDKSLHLSRRFDNVIMKAQYLYLQGKDGYTEYIEEAKKIDKLRAENFLRHSWIDDTGDVKPTIKELLVAAKLLFRKDIK